jgi:hypothetical protein
MKISYLVGDPVPDFAELDRRMERIASLGYYLGNKVKHQKALDRVGRGGILRDGFRSPAKRCCYGHPLARYPFA